MKNIIISSFISILLIQCGDRHQNINHKNDKKLIFNPEVLTVKSNGNFQKARGQILYLPLYSNIPYIEKKEDYDLSGFLTIHNTDLSRQLIVTHIYFFDNNGALKKDFLEKGMITFQPLQSQSFFIPEKDKSGTGANFLVEWKTESPINIPLIETVMLSLKGGQGVSFLSTGKVIEQMD